MMRYLRLMRVKHYIKNMLVFMPLIFSGNALNFFFLKKTILGFFAFSLVASAVYIINDIHDLEYDKCHNSKKMRPIASGQISLGAASFTAVILVITSSALMLFTATNYTVWIFILSYIIINIAYSIKLKNIPLVDISIIVSGFILRIAFGGAIINTHVSSWMYLTVMSMAFYLALGKRRNEILHSDSVHRAVLQSYTPAFLDKMMYVTLGLTVMFYSMWCVAPNEFVRSDILIWTVPLVLLICMRYSMNVESESCGDPAEVLLGDRILMVLVLIYVVFLITLFYGGCFICTLRVA
jgi:decaprenyl-phosphate phosphoribosyltransferase